MPRDLLRRQPPGWLAAAVALTQLLVLGAAAAARPVVQEREERLSLRAHVEGGTVAVRGRGTDGILRLRVTNEGGQAVVARQAGLEGRGLVAQGLAPQTTFGPGGDALLDVRYAVPDCTVLPTGVAVRLSAVRADGRTGSLVVPVSDAVAAGCRPAVVPGVAVVGVRLLRAQAERADGGLSASGTVVLEVASTGAGTTLVAAAAAVPGVLFVTPSGPERPLPTGSRRELPLSFTIPYCPAVRPRGRVVLTVLGAGPALREIGFAVSADGEARVHRDVDLDPVLQACSGGPGTAG